MTLPFLLTTTSSMHAHYWQDNSWYTMLRSYINGPTIETIIPDLLNKRDQAIISNPDQSTTKTCTNSTIYYKGQEYCIEQISCPITSGPIHYTFNHLISSIYPSLPYPIQLRRDTCNILQNPLAISSYILLHDGYNQLPDAAKLFCLHHEIQHHRYQDIADNHLSKIIELNHSAAIQAQLDQHKKSLQQHIVRYIEYRAEMQATLAMQCPHCLQEVAEFYNEYRGNVDEGTYCSQGYFYGWQFKHRITQLHFEQKGCKHHHYNGCAMNLSIIDGTSLPNRLLYI